MAVEVTFTQDSIDAIKRGAWQQVWPGAYVHQSQTAYCKAGWWSGVTFDQRVPHGELIDPGTYHLRLRVCTDHACYETDQHDPLLMAALITTAAPGD